MRLQSVATVLVLGALIAVPFTSIACGPGFVEPPLAGSLDGSAGAANGPSGEGAGEDSCKKLEPVSDFSGMAACCEDKGAQGHCLEDEKATAGIRKNMSQCTGGGWCVPDSVLKTGGKPKKCTTQFSGPNAPGACRSLCIPEVYEKKDLLKQQDCDPGEVCAPCINPLTGQPSGACPNEEDEKKAEDDCKEKQEEGGSSSTGDGGATPPGPPPKKCCEDRGTCLAKDIVPEKNQSNTNSNGCDAETQKCVPTEMMGGNYKGAKCTPNFLLGGGAGVCLSTCLEFGLQGLLLTQGECDDDHVCAPCVFGGKPTGAPGCE